MVTGLAHVCFVVADLERAIAFYQDQLGVKIAFEFRREDGSRYGVYLKLGGRNFIELFQGKVAANVEKHGEYHICLEVDDVTKTVAAWRAKGVKLTDPQLGSDHSWQAWTTDPEGHRIEIHSYTPESWQAPHLAP